MTDTVSQAIAGSWTVPFWPTILLLLLATVYIRGWRQARVTRPRELPSWRAGCFLAGLFVFWLAIASPVDALGQFLLVAHMTQHLALMSIAPPLLVLGAPTVPLLRGLPRRFVRDDLAPWMNSKGIHTLQKLITHPAFGWLGMNISFIGWHVPAAYELALRSNGWHDVEHSCFFFTSLAFWWFVLKPWPTKDRHSMWIRIPYLFTADLVNTGLSAFLVFCGRVVYPTYASVPRIFEISAMNDQSAAGAEMWVLGSMAFWIPLMAITLQLFTSQRKRRRQEKLLQARVAKDLKQPQSFDLLRVPAIGAFLRSRYGRQSLQFVSLCLMALVIFHGLRGTPLTFQNLSGALLWNILRPLNLLLFLFAGNLFCMACPFTLPRELARRLGLAKLTWPVWLKNKWSAVVLLILFFWAYEQYAFWDSPRATALLLIAYVSGAFVIDSIFRGANFCKYVCPIGQFNFVASVLSPMELGAKSTSVCNSCSTHDCIKGNTTQRGCELQLYLPNKVGNLDCTMCMDCVKACPHDNVAITLQSPIRDLVRDPVRSSLRRLSTREDVALLVLVLIMASIVNAGIMISPVTNLLDGVGHRYPFLSFSLGSLLATFAFSGILLIFCFGSAKLLQLLSGQKSLRSVLSRFALALLPLGIAMWAAHLSFHLVSTWPSLPVILSRAVADFSSVVPLSAIHSAMQQMPAVCRSMDVMLIPGAKGMDLLSLQLWLLDAGLLFSLYGGWRVIRQLTTSGSRIAATTFAWALGCTGFYALCVWIFTQPMEMRGMGM